MASPYIKDIDINSIDSHQTSPAYMLTFIRYANRSTFNYEGDAFEVRRPLIVISDAISVDVNISKSSTTSSVSMVLKGGDINYMTAIAPGDYVFVNMVNWNDKVSIVDEQGNETGANTLYKRVLDSKPINTINDGFKGVFKVQAPEEILATEPNSGNKMLAYSIQGFGFTEFNTSIYYDPQIYSQLQGNLKIFMQQFEGFFTDLAKDKAQMTVQNIIPVLINSLIGQSKRSPNSKLPQPQITYFKLPPQVGSLLGVKADYAADMYNYYLGVQTPSSGRGSTIAEGFNPSISRDSSLPAGFYKTNNELQGTRIVDAEFWNNVKVWDILKKYSNDLINEMFTTYKVNPEGRVMPSLVLRQKPFTSQHFQKSGKDYAGKGAFTDPVSRHLEMPRWRLSPNLVYSHKVRRDEAARINFVQVFTRSIAANDARNRALQTGTQNYYYDLEDIQRHGLKPYLATANFDYPINGKATKAKSWAELVSDWLFDGQLRMSGTFNCYGIELPVGVGENIEYRGVVFHIESIQHSIKVASDGRKQFRTNIQVSFGMDARSDVNNVLYPEMQYTDAHTRNIDDYATDRVMPGISDSQKIAGRVNGEETRETREKSFTLEPKKRNTSNVADGTNDNPEPIESKDKNNFSRLDPKDV